MGKIRTKEEQTAWCRQQMRDHDPESLEWWAANACLLQQERNRWMWDAQELSSKLWKLKKEHKSEILELKAKMFDMQEKLTKVGLNTNPFS